jgi:ParB family chromosome partitioning protein
VLQRARDERAEAAQVAEITEQLATAGVRIIDRPSYSDRSAKLLTDLTTPGGRAIKPERHTRCPGHAAYIQRGYREARAVYLCTDWKAQGHHDRWSSGTAAAKPTGEQASAERREVIAHNKAWRSAEAVRRRWITDFLTRKTPPKGASAYVAGELAHGGHEIRRALEFGQPLSATLLGVGGPARDTLPPLTTTASDARAQVISLGIVLAAIEAATNESLWRHSTATVRRYLAFLAANGYPLSEVEQLAAAEPTT